MKINPKKTALILALAALGGLLAGSLILYGAGNAHAGDIGPGAVEVEKTIAAEAVEALEVCTVGADVRWRETGGDRFQIRLHGRWDGPNRPELVVRDHGGLLAVEVKHRPFPNLGFHFHNHLALDIHVPKGIIRDVKIRTVSGDIRFDALEAGRLEIVTVSGDLEAGLVQAVETSLGTTSGDFRISLRRGGLSFRSVSGGLRAAFAEFTDDAEIESVSGDIDLDLPEGAAFGLSARSVSGDLYCGFPVFMRGNDHRRLEGIVAGGAHEVRIRTVSGDARVY